MLSNILPRFVGTVAVPPNPDFLDEISRRATDLVMLLPDSPKKATSTLLSLSCVQVLSFRGINC